MLLLLITISDVSMRIPRLRPHPAPARAITPAVHVNHIELPPLRAAIIRCRRRTEKKPKSMGLP